MYYAVLRKNHFKKAYRNLSFWDKVDKMASLNILQGDATIL